MPRPRAILADDHAMVVDGLRGLLKDHVDLVATVGNGQDLLDAARRLKPDLVITDISMPGMGGFEALQHLVMERTGLRIIVLTMHADAELATEALRAGASGYVLKHAAGEELITAIREVMLGRSYVSSIITHDLVDNLASATSSPARRQLTVRQREVLRLLGQGKRIKEVAALLRLSPRTVEMHKYEMMQTLGLATAAELIHYFVKHEQVISVSRADPVRRRGRPGYRAT